MPTGSSTRHSTKSWVPSLPGDRGRYADASTSVVAEAAVRGKSELHRAGCWVTPRGREPTESGTESRPPAGARLPFEARREVRGFESVEFVAVRREENARADALVNETLDRVLDSESSR